MNDQMTETPERPGSSAVRVGLALGAIVLGAVVIFGLGVMEGSRVAELAPVAVAPPNALPTETLETRPVAPVAATAAIPPDKLTFYDRLSGTAPAAPLALPEGQAPVQGAATAPPAPSRPPETPARQLEVKQPPPAAVADKRTPSAAASKPPVARPAAPSKSDPAAQIRKLVGKGRFAVQVAAVGDRSAAAETAALVKRNGFEAVTVMASVKGKVFYRIRVGSFPSKKAAAQAAGIFHSAFGLNAIPVEN